MAGHTVDIVSSSVPKESPINVNDLKDLLTTTIKEDDDAEKLISTLLKELSKKTSKYKILAKTTRIKGKEDSSSDVNVKSSFGAMWDQERDGLVCFKVGSGDVTSPGKDQEANEQASEDEEEKTTEDTKATEESEPGNGLVTLVSVLWVYVG